MPEPWLVGGGLATGLGVLWEPPSRQEELAIYVVPQVCSDVLPRFKFKGCVMIITCLEFSKHELC